jgi:hypothetical protein
MSQQGNQFLRRMGNKNLSGIFQHLLGPCYPLDNTLTRNTVEVLKSFSCCLHLLLFLGDSMYLVGTEQDAGERMRTMNNQKRSLMRTYWIHLPSESNCHRDKIYHGWVKMEMLGTEAINAAPSKTELGTG